MAKNRHFLFGDMPFEFLASHLVQDEAFRADAQVILSISEPGFTNLATALNSIDGFIDHESLTAVIQHYVKVTPERIAAIIVKLARMIHKSEKSAAEVFEYLSGLIKHHQTVAKEQSDSLITRISALAYKPEGFARQYKAEKLAIATGNGLVGSQVICDMRPIFDDSRELIQGLIPIITMQLQYTDADGSEKTFEVRLTPTQVDEIQAKLQAVPRKSKAITEIAFEGGLLIPNLKGGAGEGIE